KKDVLQALKGAPRLAPVRTSDGVDSMNAVAEMMRDLGRVRADMWEVAFWEDILDVTDGEANMVYQVHNESVVVPENVDAVRALTGLESEGRKSDRKSTRLNSSHVSISYAVFCLKKKIHDSSNGRAVQVRF